MKKHAPWASGPGEILMHGQELLKKDTDTNRRLAMISIDNAVELMIKTYLGLPYRVTGLKIPRNAYQEFAESFPKLLDALEKYAINKLDGIDLGEIEWYHRLRNQLYHQGNGLTVERNKVDVYAELANGLFFSLFGFKLVEPQHDSTALLGEFMQAWTTLEKILIALSLKLKLNVVSKTMPFKAVELLEREGYLSRVQANEIKQLRNIRNEVVHGAVNHTDVLKPDTITSLNAIINDLQKQL